MKVLLGLIGGLIVSTAVLAADKDHKHRQLDAHEHGHGKLSLAIEGNSVVMEIEAPGADIVGFEHVASSKKDKAQVAAAKKKLAALKQVVTFPDSAGCKIKTVDVELHIETSGGEKHADEKKHSKKKHAHGHSHGKLKKKKAESTHSEFHASYELMCAQPDKIIAIDFPYFKTFKGAKELEVNVIAPNLQRQFEVTAKKPSISLGAI